jgi:F-type H+-transporting ATPase subunit epsilon
MNAFRLQVYSQEKKAYDGQVVSIIVPGADGFLGVQAHHAALVAVLGRGKLWLRREDGQEETFQVEGGVMEVARNVATLLADRVEPAA